MKKLILVICLFSMLLGLCGCGGETGQETSEAAYLAQAQDPDVPPYYKVEFLALGNHLQEAGLIRRWEDSLLCIASESGTSALMQNLFWSDFRGETRTDIPLKLEENEGIRAMEIAQDGSILLVVSQQVDVERRVEYGIPYTHEGGRILVLDTSGTKTAEVSLYSEDAEFSDIAVSQEGEIYLLRCEYDEEEGFFTDHYVDMYSAQGELLGSLRIRDAFPNESRVVGTGFLTTPAGEVLLQLQINDSESVYVLSMSETEYTTPVFTLEDGMAWPHFYSGPGADYYVQDDNLGFVAYSLKDEPKALFHFSQLNTTVPDNAHFVAEIGEYTYLFAVYLDSDNYYFTITGQFEPIPETEKTVLTIGSYTEYAGGSLLQKATLYNILHPEVELQVKMYSIDENSSAIYVEADEANEALQLDIVGGEGPDILILDEYGFTPGIYSENGYLTDLTAMMQGDDTFVKEDYFYNLWEDGTGVVSYMPITFGITTLFAPAELAGSGGWTPTETLAMAEETGTPFVCYMDMLRQYVLGEGIAAYIDGETCCFDDGEFAAMLELMTLTVPETETEDFLLKKRKTLAEFGDVRQITDLMFAEDQYGAFSLKGIPSPKKEALSIRISSGIGIAENCEQKEIAWDFIRFMLDISDSSFMGYSVKREEILSGLEAAMLPEDDPASPLATTSYGVGNVDLVGRALTEDEAAFILEQIESASPTMVDVDIQNIVQEECEAFFAGDKTAEEVAALIQSRVKILLSERS